MFAVLALALAQLTPAAPAPAQIPTDAPVFRVELTRIEELARAFLDSSALEFWRRRPLLQGDSAIVHLLGRSAGEVEGISALLPTRIRFVAGAECRAFAQAVVRYGSVIRLVRDEEALGGEDFDEMLKSAGPVARAEFAAMATSFASFRAELSMEWKDEEAAQRALPMIEGLLLSLGVDAASSDTPAEIHALRSIHDVGALITPASLREFIDDVSPKMAALWTLPTAMTVTQEGNRITARLGQSPADSETELDALEVDPDADSGGFLHAQWDLGDRLADEIVAVGCAAYGRNVSDLDETERDEMRTTAAASLPGRGSLECETTDVGTLDLVSRSIRSPDAILLHETGLLELIPHKAGAWSASGTTTLIDLLEGFIAGSRQAIERPEVLADEDDRQTARKLISALQATLEDARGAFMPGAAAIASTHLVTQADGITETLPALTLMGRPVSAKAGFAALRSVFETLESSLGGTVTPSSEQFIAYSIQWRPGSPRHVLVAKVDEGSVILSTSIPAFQDLLQRHLSAETGVDVAPDILAAFETSGVRAGDLAAAALRSLGRRLALPTDRRSPLTIFGVANAARTILHGVGRIESRTTSEGEWATTRVRIHPRTHDRRDVAAEFLERTGVGEWPDEKMLIARGKGSLSGADMTFEMVFTRDGEFRYELVSGGGSTTYSSRFGESAWGTSALMKAQSEDLTAWGMAIAGAWASSDTPVQVEVVDETSTEITLRVVPDGSIREPYVVLSADTLNCVRTGNEWRGLTTDGWRTGSTFKDHRRVEGMSLPHSIETPVFDILYEIDSWEFVPFDETLLSPEAPALARYEPDAGTVKLERMEDWYVMDGTIGGEPAKFFVAPLRMLWNLAIPDPASESLFTWADVVAGPLSGGPFRFSHIAASAVPVDGARALVGINALMGACVRLDVRADELELLPPGSFTGDNFQRLRMIDGHLAFEATLPGGESTWASPALGERSRTRLIVPTLIYEGFAESLGEDTCPLREGIIPFLDLAGHRIKARRLIVNPPRSYLEDPTPVVFSMRSFHKHVLELDLPNARYRMVPRR